MPITRYQIRNEYSLADPELYLAANKDDPEALLEGVAMAGLVGVLRQLGDLSEFAAEIFHSLHEEVMVTAARGHSLTARVQQLEAEVPLIEKAILSQTNHSSSLHTAGVEWHPNLRMNQNMITQGDLPRFVMDSYEECRGPPRLFILDKFDIAGAGACLKRYTNPSFFKVEPASSGTPNVDSQRDRRIRKVKKKGARGRNGETPEILPTSNVKLHRLFLEDRAENSGSEPARLVKLKKRHLQGSPFNSQTGKSYMQKLFQTSPEHKFVRDIPIDPPSDNLISNSSAHGPKILDIQTVSSATESLQSIRDRYETPTAQETVQNSSMDEMSEEVSDGENLHMAAIGHDHEMDKVMSMLYKTADEKKLAVDRESTPESSVNESEIDVASETDNFMDALNSLESEIETDTECRRKNSLNLFNGEKHGADSDANNEPNKDLSANGFLPFSKGTASSSYSDLSGLAGAGSAEVAAVESVDMSFDKMCIGDEVLGTKSRQDSAANSRCSEVSVVPTIHAEHDKLPLDGECSGDVSSAGSEGKFDTDELGRELFNTDTNGNSTGEILPMVTVSSIPSLKTVLPSESCQSINLDSGLDPEENDINVVLHTDDDSCRSSLSECSEHLLSDLEPDCEDNCIENVENAVDENVIRYYRSKVSSTEAQILSSTFPEPEPLSGITQQPNALQASTTDNSEDPAPLVDNPQLKSSSEQKSSERTYSFQAIDRNLVETGVLHSQETTVNGGVCSTKDFGEIDASACNGDGIARKIVSSKFSSEYPDYETFEDQVHEHTRIRNVPAKAEGGMAPSIAVSVNNGRQSSNLLLEMPCSSSRNSMDMQDSLSISACPQQKRVEMHESSPPECHVESDVPAKQSMASSGATRDDEHNNISPIRDVTTSELQTEQETELETHHPTRTLDISKTFGSVRTRHTLDPGYHTKQIVEGQADQLDAATPKFSFSHYEQESELNDISQDRYLSTTRESSLDDLPGQASISNSSLQSTSIKLESYEKAMATPLPFFPKVSLLSPGSQVSIEEPPHLPPLPPLQWRVGKLPHEHSFDSFPPIPPPPTDNENAQSDAITSTENQQSHNPFLQPSDIINNESQYVTADFAGPSPLSLPIPTTVTSSADNQYLTTSIGSKQSLNPFVSLPSSPERPQDSSVTVEEKRTHHASNVLSLETPVENANSAEDKELEHNFQNSREKVSNLMLFHPPPLVENLQPQFGQEGPGEISNPNENTTVKLPRPRNPLIDAVAAHGKNSLRKVIERARPPIEKEVEERDTMLEQIRNKTFNLKPAVPIRPRIQPPQTNLKMAAILEKANKIRQATVGSDEDDDDNWSDD